MKVQMKTFSFPSSLTVVLVSVLLAYIYTSNPYFNLETVKSINIPASLSHLTASINTYLINLLSASPPTTNLTISPPTTTITPSQLAAMSGRVQLPRRILKTLLAKPQSEGAGATVRRSIGTPSLRSLNPFLMLDHFSVSPGAGFPDHPHRGQETITYLLTGGMDHEDFTGNRGTLNPGDLQFMTAGKGIMHAEMPRQNPDGSANVGLQLWVDLPKELKYCEPRYRDLKAEEIPTVVTEDDKVKIKVISGKSYGVESLKNLAYTPVVFYDVEVQPGGKVEQEVPKGWQGFAYVLEGGDVTFGDGKDGKEKKVSQWHNVVFGNEQEGDGVVARVDESETKPGRFVLIAGQMMDQPVVQYGPFVLNSQEEVYQAFVDYQSHTNGFERAKGWKSEIGKSMVH
ncbi:RmlC-like cupin domain-containing protein [Triangularia setosa]|uniref:RmlC-like cupin domain-containing protein n=1 Tax=Triangularia setosa TaxID=2587417 RepID=A0AAN7A8P0_9PEZI|nr:RmlC-like cupin domain-containing protein [Podospora setosa]